MNSHRFQTQSSTQPRTSITRVNRHTQLKRHSSGSITSARETVITSTNRRGRRVLPRWPRQSGENHFPIPLPGAQEGDDTQSSTRVPDTRSRGEAGVAADVKSETELTTGMRRHLKVVSRIMEWATRLFRKLHLRRSRPSAAANSSEQTLGIENTVNNGTANVGDPAQPTQEEQHASITAYAGSSSRLRHSHSPQTYPDGHSSHQGSVYEEGQDPSPTPQAGNSGVEHEDDDLVRINERDEGGTSPTANGDHLQHQEPRQPQNPQPEQDSLPGRQHSIGIARHHSVESPTMAALNGSFFDRELMEENIRSVSPPPGSPVPTHTSASCQLSTRPVSMVTSHSASWPIDESNNVLNHVVDRNMAANAVLGEQPGDESAPDAQGQQNGIAEESGSTDATDESTTLEPSSLTQ